MPCGDMHQSVTDALLENILVRKHTLVSGGIFGHLWAYVRLRSIQETGLDLSSSRYSRMRAVETYSDTQTHRHQINTEI